MLRTPTVINLADLISTGPIPDDIPDYVKKLIAGDPEHSRNYYDAYLRLERDIARVVARRP